MKELLREFVKVRKDFINTLKKFPNDKYEEKLFGEWSLKDVIAHFTGWDRYFIDAIELLSNGKKVPYWGKINRYNLKNTNKA